MVTFGNEGLGTMSYRSGVQQFDLAATEALASQAATLADDISAISRDVNAVLSGTLNVPGAQIRKIGRMPLRGRVALPAAKERAEDASKSPAP